MIESVKLRPQNSPQPEISQAHVTLASFQINMQEKSFYLCGAIEVETPRRVYMALAALRTLQDGRPIRMYLSTEGGDVESGLAIYGLLAAIPEHLEIVVTGYAYSMGMIILQAADSRIAQSTAFLMAHWGHQAIEDNNPDNYERKILHQKALDNMCDGILLEKMKKKKKSMSLNKVRALTKLDWYMNPETALKYGLIDEIE